jgi:hypothetical protein
MKFEHIYSFQAFSAVEEGETVYVLDKKTKKIFNVADLAVGEFVEVLKKAEEEKTRFEFWKDMEENENAEEL